MSRTLAENIAVLSFLDQIPTSPQPNEPRCTTSRDDSTRVLSFDRERSLASTIALLAGISDNSSHIIACCIEEVSSSKEMRVLVAINKQNPTDGDDKLERIKWGLKKIFDLLCQSSAESGSESALEKKVLDAIVEMCQERLLSRIGYLPPDASDDSHKPTAPSRSRNFLGGSLQQVLDALRQHTSKRKRSPETQSFINGAQELLVLLKDFPAYKGGKVRSHLGEIVASTSRLVQGVDLANVLSVLKPEMLQSTTRDGIVRRLGKLAQYEKSSRSLFKMAKKLRQFNRIAVVPISLGEKKFTRTNPPENSSLIRCLDRCQQGRGQKMDAKSICGKLKVDVKKADAEFNAKTKQILTKSKFHAEVQLVAYYEINQPGLNSKLPRVIASSKDACYLCNLFVQLHGRFWIPKTHGRLYHGWRIPDIPAFQEAQAKVVEALERRINQAITEIMAGAKKTLPQPNESTIFDFCSSTSTIASDAREDQLPMQALGTMGAESGTIQGTRPKEVSTTADAGTLTDAEIQRSNSVVSQVKEQATVDEVPVEVAEMETHEPDHHLGKLGPSQGSLVPERTTTQDVTIHTKFSPRLSAGQDDPPVGETSELKVAKELSVSKPPTPTMEPPSAPLLDNLTTAPSAILPTVNLPPIPSPEPDKAQLRPSELFTNIPPFQNDSPHPSPSKPSQPRHGSPKRSLLPDPKSLQPPISIALIQGQTIAHRLDIPSPTPSYTTGKLTIHPEYTHSPTPGESQVSSATWPSFPESSVVANPRTGRPGANKSPGPAEMQIRWLLPEEAQRVDLKNQHFADLLPSTVDYDSGSKERVYLANEGHVVLVEVIRYGRR